MFAKQDRGGEPPAQSPDGDRPPTAEAGAGDLGGLTDQSRELEDLDSVRSLEEDLAVSRVRFRHAAADGDALKARAAEATRRAEGLITEQQRRLQEMRSRLEALGVTDETAPAATQHEVAHLRQAAAWRPVIAQAVGILVVVVPCGADEALAVLVVGSDLTGMTLPHLARRLTEAAAAGQLDSGEIRSWYSAAEGGRRRT